MDINKISGLPSLPSLDGTSSTSTAPSFGQTLGALLKQTVNTQREAEKMTVAAAQGQDIPLTDVISAVNKADLTLQTMMSVRDRAVEAYQEIQRMPI